MEGGVEVSLETVLQHALKEEVDGGNIGAVRHFGDSRAASEQANVPALAIDDNRARVPLPREGTRLGVTRQDGDLFRHPTGWWALEVDLSKRTNGIKASDGKVGGGAALNDHNA